MQSPWARLGLGLLNLLVVVALTVGAQTLLRKRVPDAAGMAIVVAVFLVLYVLGARWIERRTPTELQLGRAAPELAFGLVLGMVLFSIVMGLLWAFGDYHPAGWNSVAALRGRLLAGLLAALLAGVFEEGLFRGFLFRLTSTVAGTWGALLFTSVLFGAAHLFNPAATVTSSLAIALEAGVLLGAAFVATGRLWLPIGLHAGWNFTEGPVFGAAISGNSTKSGWIAGSLSGPALLTGGSFGPEASVLAVIVCLAAASGFLWYVVRYRKAEAPAWRRRNVPVVSP